MKVRIEFAYESMTEFKMMAPQIDYERFKLEHFYKDENAVIEIVATDDAETIGTICSMLNFGHMNKLDKLQKYESISNIPETPLIYPVNDPIKSVSTITGVVKDIDNTQ